MPKIVRSTDELITNNITGALLPASGTTGERPSTPVNGQIRYNTTTPGLETFVDGAWSTLAAASGVGSFVRRDGDTMAGTLTFLDGNQLIADETGTVSVPAIAFDGDLDTGIYQNTGNVVGIAGQGANVALFDGSVATPVNYFTFSSSATANPLILTNAGSDTNGVGLGITVLGKAASAAGDGGPIVIIGGAGDTTGVGGAINFTAGLGGATSAGGAASLTGGAGQDTAAGGNTTIAGGASGGGTTGTGGEVHVHGGDSAATNGPGGQAHFHGGLGIGTGAGGLATVFGGVGGATGTGGAVTLIGGASGGVGGTAGSVTIDAGALAGGGAGTVTIAGTDATTLTLGNTSFPVATTAIGILALTAANTLSAVNAATGGATLQFLQFNDTGDVFSWENLETTFKGFSTITDDASTTIEASFQDELLLLGATSGGITTVATEAPDETVTFSITPTDLATTGATIVGADFLIVSDAADAATVVGQKVTFTAALNDLGVGFTGGTLDLAQFLLLAGGTMTGALVVDDAGDPLLPDLAWTGDLDTGLTQVGVADTLSIVAGGIEVAQFIGTVLDDNFFTLTSSATGVTPIFGNSGTDTNGIGLGLALVGKAASAAGNGGPITLTTGAGNDTGDGGLASIAGGAGGVTGDGGQIDLTGGIGGATSGTGGALVFAGGAAGATTGVGGAVSLTGGAGTGALAGGLASLIGGVGGATGAGGAVNVNAGNAGATSGIGGLIAFTAGDGTGAGLGAGGAIVETSGASAVHTTGTASASGAITFTVGTPGGATTGTGGLGGAISFTGATGGAASSALGTGGAGSPITFTAGTGGSATDTLGGAAGTISLLGGVGGATSLDTGIGGAGSDVVITAGTGGASDTGAASVGGAAGDVTITAGTGGSSTTGTGGIAGTLIMTAGDGAEATAGGIASLTGGAGDLTGIGGAASLVGGVGGATSGKGGNASLVGGDGAGTDAEGGDVFVTGGDASATNADGGDINITPGLLQGTGKDGTIRLAARTVPVITNVPVPGTGTDTEVLTEAEMFGGIFIQTPTGATTCTTPSGTDISAGFATTPVAGDSFEFTLINLGGTTDWDITLSAGDGNVTFIGSVLLAPAIDDPSEASSGTWRFRNTGASTWIGYRL